MCSKRVVTSSTESECHGLVEAAKEGKWIKKFVKELDIFPPLPPTLMYQDNMSAIKLAGTTDKFHKRSRHFSIEFDFFREMVDRKKIEVKYLSTNILHADMLTKPLPRPSFVAHRERMMGGGGGIEIQRDS
jgi:hypothetical protein